MSEEERREPCDLVELANEEAIENRKNFEANIKNVWGYSGVGLEAKKAAMTMLSTKTGMYARIPLMCKSDDCPYKDSCSLLAYNLAPFGEPCPIETAQIELRYVGYAADFDLDISSFTDKNLVAEIINCDIMMERCKALMAKEQIPIIDVVAGIAENGEVYNRPEVSKAWEVYSKVTKRRNEAYQLMMATRRDKKGSGEQEKSVQQILSEITSVDSFVIDEKPEDIKE